MVDPLKFKKIAFFAKHQFFIIRWMIGAFIITDVILDLAISCYCIKPTSEST